MTNQNPATSKILETFDKIMAFLKHLVFLASIIAVTALISGFAGAAFMSRYYLTETEPMIEELQCRCNKQQPKDQEENAPKKETETKPNKQEQK